MALSTMRQILNKHPIMKGMLAYSITWPTGNIIQQTMAGKRWGNNICSFLFAFKTHTCMKQLCSLTKCLYNFFFSIFSPHFRHQSIAYNTQLRVTVQTHTIGRNVYNFHCTVHCMLLQRCTAG